MTSNPPSSKENKNSIKKLVMEKGAYTPVPHWLLDFFGIQKIPRPFKDCLHYLWRNTVGWDHWSFQVSNRDIEKVLGIKRQNVSRFSHAMHAAHLIRYINVRPDDASNDGAREGRKKSLYNINLLILESDYVRVVLESVAYVCQLESGQVKLDKDAKWQQSVKDGGYWVDTPGLEEPQFVEFPRDKNTWAKGWSDKHFCAVLKAEIDKVLATDEKARTAYESCMEKQKAYLDAHKSKHS